MAYNLKDFMANIIAKNPGEVEFHQAVEEVAESLIPLSKKIQSYEVSKNS
jgi:glutamate dehydrogenase (NADP+)